MKKFTHVDQDSPSMVDVGDKLDSERIATARSRVQLPEEMRSLVAENEIKTLKGPVFQTAIIAGIQGAKKTSELIPLCHVLLISKVLVEITIDKELLVEIICQAKCTGKTGVEMEALTGASIAALTIYDMCKAFSQNIIIQETRLINKSGGKTDFQL